MFPNRFTIGFFVSQLETSLSCNKCWGFHRPCIFMPLMSGRGTAPMEIKTAHSELTNTTNINIRFNLCL